MAGLSRVMESPVAIQAAAYVAPQINWTIDPKIQDACRKLAFFLGVIWIAWIAVQFALPKNRGNMMGGGGGGGIGRFILAGVPILMLLDLNLVKTAVNWVLQAFWGLGHLLGFV